MKNVTVEIVGEVWFSSNKSVLKNSKLQIDQAYGVPYIVQDYLKLYSMKFSLIQ